MMLAAGTMLLLVGCATGTDVNGPMVGNDSVAGAQGTGGAAAPVAANPDIDLSLHVDASPAAGSPPGPRPDPTKLPDGFTKTDLGAFKHGVPLTAGAFADAGEMSNDECGNTILAVARDFMGKGDPWGRPGHPDFESYGSLPGAPPQTLGMVEAQLGADQKPVYTGIYKAGHNTGKCIHGDQTTSKTTFDQWYRHNDGVDRPYLIYLWLEPNLGKYTFLAHEYFPIDGDIMQNQGQEHNFEFTTEIHDAFHYNGGEQFTFIGDDDVWVFINKKLAVDLGGLHEELTGNIDLDARATELGIKTGNTYALDLFHAERHTSHSHFRMDTDLQFTNCGVVVPDIVK